MLWPRQSTGTKGDGHPRTGTKVWSLPATSAIDFRSEHPRWVRKSGQKGHGPCQGIPWLCPNFVKIWGFLTSFDKIAQHLFQQRLHLVRSKRLVVYTPTPSPNPEESSGFGPCTVLARSRNSPKSLPLHMGLPSGRLSTFSTPAAGKVPRVFSRKFTVQRKNGLAMAMLSHFTFKPAYAKLGRKHLQFQTLGVEANKFLAL